MADPPQFELIRGDSRTESRSPSVRPGSRSSHSRQIAARAERAEAAAHQRWRAGLVVPHVITMALDFHDLFGPEVDLACHASEPAVDRWEAGKLYPRWDQLCALTELTQWPTARFMVLGHPIGIADTSMRFHLPRPWVERVDLRGPVTRYPDDVVARCPGTEAWSSWHQ